MEANSSKSVVLVAGDNASFREGVLAIFGYSLGSLPIKHLGVLLISISLSSVDCRRLQAFKNFIIIVIR